MSALLLPAVAGAKTFDVTTRKDTAPNGCTRKNCTVREALIAANRHGGKDKVILPSKRPYKLKIAPKGNDGPTTGDLGVTDPVTIKHTGKGNATIDAQGIDRVLFADIPFDSTEVYSKLDHITVTGGVAANGTGGGLKLGDTLIGLDHSTVTGNRADFGGGGIYASAGELTVTDSTVSNNISGTQGGGILSVAETKITGSTISGNHSLNPSGEGGGGIANEGPDLTMANSTVVGNAATAEGGGIDSPGTAKLNDVTIAANKSDSDNVSGGPGGGIFANGSVAVANSIIEGNLVGTSGSAPDCRGTFTSGGHNMVNATIGCIGFNAPGDFMDPQPLFGPFGRNGGPTKTLALKKGSPAIGKAGPSSQKRDQRGRARDKHPDIGAYEYGAKP